MAFINESELDNLPYFGVPNETPIASELPPPLGWLRFRLFPIFRRFARASARDLLDRRYERTRQLRDSRRALAQSRKQLSREIKWFSQILLATWERQGYYHRPGHEFDGPEHYKPKGKKRIRFEAIIASDLEIRYKIKTRQRGMFRYKSALPFGVRIMDLIDPKTIEELCRACDRKVVIIPTEYHQGTWISVYRLRGQDGIPTLIPFKHLISLLPQDTTGTPVLLGVKEGREVLLIYFNIFPHVLVGGGAGSGKSNVLNCILCQMMLYSTPETLQLILIDLKMGLEFNLYKNAVHLNRPVVTTEEEAIQVLSEAYQEMKRRMDRISKANLKNIDEWNAAYPDDPMPRLFVVIDEFAELRLSEYSKVAAEAERLATRLANIGRAPGVHLILCTQRPATDTVSNKIKTNMPLIIGGRVQSIHQSGVILNNGRADQLPMIRGRMIVETGQTTDTIQVPLIRNEDVVETVRIARGKHAGLIYLEGGQVVPIHDAIRDYIIRMHDGQLAEGTFKALLEFGLTTQHWNTFLDVLKEDSNLIQRDGTWYIRRMTQQEPHKPEPVVILNPNIALPIREVLLLPAHIEPRDPSPAPEVLDTVGVLRLFVEVCCTFGEKARVESAAVFDAYEQFARRYDVPTIHKRKLTAELRKLFPSIGTFRKGDVRYVTGLTLKLEFMTSESSKTTTSTLTTDEKGQNGEDLAA